MIGVLEKLGDRMLTAFVPAIEANAASMAGCTHHTCGKCLLSTGCELRFRECCNGVCSPCNDSLHCCSAKGCCGPDN